MDHLYLDGFVLMTPWQRWIQQPQNLWVRKMFFQVHLWFGIGVGLYVAVISVSGSVLVYRPKPSRTRIVADAGRRRMHVEDVEQAARRAYPAYQILSVTDPQKPDEPDIVVMEARNRRVARVFNPYTGADLGDLRSTVERARQWIADLHDNLLLGPTGRMLNGIGSFLLVLLACTGMVIWWPGVKNWRRSLTVNVRARFPRFNWDLHSSVGFWCSLFVLTWGISGICLCFPGILISLLGREFRYWVIRLHFGRFNESTEAFWTILGLAPAALAATGALMWWNRVLRKKVRHRNTLIGGIAGGQPKV